MKTFVHHDGALGDVLLSLPSIRAIRKEHGFVHLAARPDIARFLKDAGAIDDASSAESGLYTSLYTDRPGEGVKDFLGRFDRAFVFTVKRDSPVAASLRSIISRVKSIITIPPDGVRTSAAEFRLKQLGREPGDLSTPLEVPSFYNERAGAILSKAGHVDGQRPLIVIHPGSGGRSNRWPLGRYFSLAEELERRNDAALLMLSGPAEGSAFKDEIEEFVSRHERVIHVINEELGTVAALLARCAYYIGNDSGISHLAAAVGAPAFVLFGPSDPDTWQPVGRAVKVIAARDGDHISALPVAEVLSSVYEIQDRPTHSYPRERGQ